MPDCNGSRGGVCSTGLLCLALACGVGCGCLGLALAGGAFVVSSISDGSAASSQAASLRVASPGSA
eukprot:8002299-Alexandrium_andersonii.AAC.1